MGIYTMAETVEGRIQAIRLLIDEFLQEEITKRAPLPNLREMMLYATFGGKRLRGAVLVSVALSLRGELEAALPFAGAMEIVHAYSLVHDDLPCMDNDDMRRGKPTVHKKFGDALAVLCGDALLTMAFEIASESGCVPLKERISCISLLAKASGVSGMVGGQTLDIMFENMSVDARDICDMYSMKTAALFSASAEIGGILGGAEKSVCKGLKNWGYQFGLAYQIADDLDDAQSGGHEDKKATLARVTSADFAKSEAANALLESYQALEGFGVKVSLLQELSLEYARRLRLIEA
jgi:geranylgeranyl pyrophosphate synthase